MLKDKEKPKSSVTSKSEELNAMPSGLSMGLAKIPGIDSRYLSLKEERRHSEKFQASQKTRKVQRTIR